MRLTAEAAGKLIEDAGTRWAAARGLSEKYGGSVSAWNGRLMRASEVPMTPEALSEFEGMLVEHGLDPAENVIQGGRISHSQVGMKMKDADGDTYVEVTPLKHTQVVFKPLLTEAEISWPVVQPVAPVTIKYVALKKEPTGSPERVLIVPDAQIGFLRDTRTEELHPMHDLDAMDAVLQVAHDYSPDRVVILGDFLDLSTMSKYLQIAEFQLTLQPALDFAYTWLAKLRSIVGPDCQIDYLLGNHERRISEYIAKNAAAAWGVRVAGTTGWPVLSIPVLLRFDELDIACSDEFPGGQVWLTRELVCQHKDPKMGEIRASIIHGHTPHTRTTSRTVHYFEGPKTYRIYSIGGVMRIDDTELPDSLCRTSVASDSSRGNWDQSFAVVDIYSESQFDVQHITLDKGWCAFRGQKYQGRATN